MNYVLEGVLYVIGGVIRLFDLSTDLWYLYTQEFKEDWLYYFSCATLICPSVIFFLTFTLLSCTAICRGQAKEGCVKLAVGVIVTLFEPVGLVLCVFGCIIAGKRSNKMDFYLVEAATRTAAFIEGIFESLPQLILQSYNNVQNDEWTAFTVTSVCLSTGGFLYTLIKLFYALDRVRHYEKREVQIAEQVKLSKDLPAEADVYEFSHN